MMIVRANKDSEAGVMPNEELIAAMGKYNEELMNAGVLVDLAGLQSSAKGARVHFSASTGKISVIDGPFAETRELVAGYWIINVKSKAEAVEWAKRIPAPHGATQDGVIEIRQFFEMEDFAPSEAAKQACLLGEKLAASKKAGGV
jgi:hypothetical protein